MGDGRKKSGVEAVAVRGSTFFFGKFWLDPTSFNGSIPLPPARRAARGRGGTLVAPLPLAADGWRAPLGGAEFTRQRAGL